MAHFTDQYSDRFNELLHLALFAHYFYKQEIIEIPGLLTAILVTYDGVPDDRREIHDNMSWEEFLTRMSVVKGDWIHFERRHMEGLRRNNRFQTLRFSTEKFLHILKQHVPDARRHGMRYFGLLAPRSITRTITPDEYARIPNQLCLYRCLR